MKQLLCLGDSITDAGRLLETPPLGYGYVAFIQKALSSDWKVTNRGVNGFTVRRVYEQIHRELPRFQPDAITLLIGINDISLMQNTNRTEAQQEEMMNAFQETYHALLALLTQNCPCIYLLEPFLFPRPLEYENWFSALKKMSQIIQNLAKEFRLSFIPLWNKLLSAADTQGPETITEDGIHLTSAGHLILANEILKYL